ncbi:unnamed protein product [[Candida] boidinii]|uniref:Unnamed protein product n=1 Tax=Candida boidinii TaxID=5477 RepID=A0A9W6T506_CANBO|nr:unnamed protein product [[Candida] boidinii]
MTSKPKPPVLPVPQGMINNNNNNRNGITFNKAYQTPKKQSSEKTSSSTTNKVFGKSNSTYPQQSNSQDIRQKSPIQEQQKLEEQQEQEQQLKPSIISDSIDPKSNTTDKSPLPAKKETRKRTTNRKRKGIDDIPESPKSKEKINLKSTSSPSSSTATPAAAVTSDPKLSSIQSIPSNNESLNSPQKINNSRKRLKQDGIKENFNFSNPPSSKKKKKIKDNIMNNHDSSVPPTMNMNPPPNIPINQYNQQQQQQQDQQQQLNLISNNIPYSNQLSLPQQQIPSTALVPANETMHTEDGRPLVGATRLDQLMLVIQARKKGVGRDIQQAADGTLLEEVGHVGDNVSLIPNRVDLVGGVEKLSTRGQKLHQCQYCLKKFTQSTHLEVHIRSHIGLKPYECKFCGKKFTQGGNLRTHSRLHTGERPFECSFCQKTFSRKGNLQAHLLTHKNVRPFDCKLDNCTKSFTQLGNLKSHQNKFHLKTLNEFTNKLAHLNSNDPLRAIEAFPPEEQEILLYLGELYKNLNRGIRGRGKRLNSISGINTPGDNSDLPTNNSTPTLQVSNMVPLPQMNNGNNTLIQPQPMPEQTTITTANKPKSGRKAITTITTNPHSNIHVPITSKSNDELSSCPK